eukprot:CAMPEP_0119041774 /NCGR_PEP_ID=MMETSP1177-20130426/13565_1 /TAXON_ID=2985 /ORGANISM="Ochromonas sp, Strain CCMP1899" /LENGTH=187 /DNA_ID=CAMNT_0007008085 /DNA_START=272 /DNA_END=835 /DNA_ORIENTATION=+
MGEKVTLLCHFENNAKTVLNITSIMGSLNENKDFSYYVQNYTQQALGVLVKPGEEITLEYKFTVDTELEPEKFRMAHTVFYETDKVAYSSTFFNQTVDLYYSKNVGVSMENLGHLFMIVFGTLLSCSLFILVLFPELKVCILFKKHFLNGGKDIVVTPVEDNDETDEDEDDKPVKSAKKGRKSVGKK